MATTSARLAGTLAACVALAAPVLAQQDATMPLDARLRAFTGCFATHSAGIAGPMVCVVPTRNAQVVELVTVARDSVVSVVPIDASGEQVARTRDGCTGWERGTFSADDRRLFVQSELTCGNGPLQKLSALYSVTGTTGFTRVESVQTRGNAGVRVVDFVEARQQRVPAEIARRLPDPDDMRTYAARVEAAAPLTTADVAEASQRFDGRVVAAWIAASEQRFELAANDLRALRDAHVSPDVIDMMVAISNPRVFSLAQGNIAMAPGQDRRGDAMVGAPIVTAYGDPYAGQPFLGGSLYGAYGYASPYGPYGAYGNWFNPYASCNLAFSCYGTGWSYGGRGPYVIITQPAPSGAAPGSVVNGSGYSQGGGSGTGRRAVPASTSIGSQGSSGATRSGGGVSTSTGGGGGAAPASAPRTAKPRP